MTFTKGYTEMQNEPTDPRRIDPKRVRLIADRLCWLQEGDAGLRRRHGLYRAYIRDGGYRDRYDLEAGNLAPEIPCLRPVFDPPGWKQASLL